MTFGDYFHILFDNKKICEVVVVLRLLGGRCAALSKYFKCLSLLFRVVYKECLEAETKFCGKAMYWNFYQTNQDNLNISCKYDYDGLLININQIINPNNFEVPTFHKVLQVSIFK